MVYEVQEAGEEVGLVLGVPPSSGWPVRAGDSSVELSTMKHAYFMFYNMFSKKRPSA
jgi:hypothetical protein